VVPAQGLAADHDLGGVSMTLVEVGIGGKRPAGVSFDHDGEPSSAKPTTVDDPVVALRIHEGTLC
jgi:hypothetical protein